MRRRLVAIIAAVIFGAAAVFLVNYYIKEKEKGYLEELDFKPVLVAATEIPEDTILLPEMLEVVECPSKYIQPMALSSPARAVGMRAVVPILSNEQVLVTKLSTPEREEIRMVERIPRGKRAVTIKIDSISAAGGFVRPGDRVDVIGTFTIEKEPLTVTIFQDVLVLAVGGEMKVGKARPGAVTSVTLALAPEDGELLTVAAQEGKIRLHLRAKGELGVRVAPVINRDTLLKRILPPREVLPEPPEEKPTCEVFRGLKREVVIIPPKK